MDTTNFKPGPSLTFDSVVAIRAAVTAALKTDNNTVFCLDLSEVTRCDSAGLALLIEIRKLCQQKSKIFKVIGVSAETKSLAEFCGVKSILETA